MSYSAPDEQRLRDILERARRARGYVAGIDRAEFDANSMRHDAVIHMIEVIGEATNHLSPEFRADHHELPWSAMVRMRNILIHAYGDVDLDEVWKVVSEDLVELIQIIEPMLE